MNSVFLDHLQALVDHFGWTADDIIAFLRIGTS